MRGFKTSEYQNRVAKLRQKMQKHNLEIILITSPHNFRYFTGLDSYFWESPTRPWFLLIPIEQEPVVVVPSIGKTALAKTWISNIVTWSSPNPEDEGITILKETILSINCNKCLIGCELGRESYLRMSINDYQKLCSLLSNHKFVNSSQLIWQLRIIKSENEISKIKDICNIASQAFDNLPNLLQHQLTETKVCNIMKKSLLEIGADYTLYMSCTSGLGGYNQIICDPTDKKLQNGDVLIIDTGTTRDGYFCDFNRNYGFGTIAESAKIANEVLWETTEIGMQTAKPGMRCSDISNAMNTILQKSGLQNNSIGRMGHGIGLQVTEPPSIMQTDDTILQSGMIIAIEPCFEYAPNLMLVHEENILITNDGYERLTSRTPKNIPIIN